MILKTVFQIMENEALRKQLEEYKHKEMESLENKIDKTIIDQENNQFELDAKRIEKKERERQKLEQQRENLAKERQRKLDEAKAMKQESLRKYAVCINYYHQLYERKGSLCEFFE